jgi:hypothetical protein
MTRGFSALIALAHLLGPATANAAEHLPEMVRIIPLANAGLQPFSMGRSEVTWAQYLPSVAGAQCPLPVNTFSLPITNAETLADDYPVTGLTVAGVNCYIDWVSKKSGHRYRLPTAPEWLYVARRASIQKNDDVVAAEEYTSLLNEPRDYVRSRSIFRADHGLKSPDGLYGLLDSAGELINEWEAVPESKCLIFKVRSCKRQLVYGLGFIRTGAPFDYKGYVFDVYPNPFVGFRIAEQGP